MVDVWRVGLRCVAGGSWFGLGWGGVMRGASGGVRAREERGPSCTMGMEAVPVLPRVHGRSSFRS